MVVGEGFEPSKSVTADLQSAPFGRLGIPPFQIVKWCRHQESNSGPTDYKSVALPTELCRHQVLRILWRLCAGCNKKIAEIVLLLTKWTFFRILLFFSIGNVQISSDTYHLNYQ